MRKIVFAVAALLALVSCGGDDDEAEARPPAVIARIDAPAIGQVGETIYLVATGSSGVGKLEYVWAIEGPSADATLPETRGPLEVRLVPDVVGDWVVNLQVRDELGRAATDSLTIRVGSVPIAEAGPDQLVHPGDTVVLDGSASRDPAGLALSYSWLCVMKPDASELVLEDGGTAVARFVADAPGTYLFVLVVDNGLSSAQSRTVSILALE